MNQFIQSIQSLDYDSVKEQLEQKPKWIDWAEKTGKNALHFLSAIPVAGDKGKQEYTLKLAKLLLKKGADINAVHRIPEKGGFFPATPLWYAYTRGRNEKLYRHYLKSGANPDNCMFAIAWYDDVKAAELFRKHGAEITNAHFLASWFWKKFKIAEWFIKKGADVNYIGKEGYSAMLLSVKRKDPIDKIKGLLQSGADIDKENKDGLSPKKLAIKNRSKLIQILFNAI